MLNKIKLKRLVLCWFISLGLLTSCSSMYDKHVQWEQVEPKEFPVLTAVGYAPISLQKADHETQRMLMAISASKIAAYAELTEQVYGQKISGNVSVENLLVKNQEMSASVRGVIRGAKVIKSYPLGDTYATELSLDFKEVHNIVNATTPTKRIKDVQYF